MRKHRRNITIVNNEIDYDKLASAIVKAQQEMVDKQQNGRCISKTFSLIISCSFYGMAIVALPLSFLFAFWVCYVIVNNIPATGFLRYIAYGVSFVAPLSVSFVLGSFSVLFWNAAKEIKKEKDKHYIISLFSGLVSFAALVVALIALLKE